MAGGASDDIPKLTGFKKYFNSYTTRGRMNFVYATYGSIFLGILYYKFKPSSSESKK